MRDRATICVQLTALVSFFTWIVACTGTVEGSPANGDPYGTPSAISGSSRGTFAGSGTGSGYVDGGQPSPSGGSDASVASTSTASAFGCTATTPDPGPNPILLLSRAQYSNTLHALFGSLVPDLTTALGPDNSYQSSRFGLAQADVDLAGVQSYQTAAEAVAAAVAATPATLSAIAPCNSATNQRACAQTFVQTFGALAYRAPVTDAADLMRHLALYDVGATTSYAHGIEMVLRGMLQSPRFLYRIEIGAGDQVGPSAVKLSGFELAARLSYEVWNSMPDLQLTNAAANGTLATKGGLLAQLARMLQDPKGSSLVRSFLEGLIRLPALPYAVKDATLFPEWSASGSTLAASMQAQARAFFDDVLGRQGGAFASLLTSSTVFLNRDLGGYYGVTGAATLQPMQLAPGRASGLLTLPALMTLMAKPNESWPIYRGKFVRESLLCQELPPPPPNIPMPPTVMAGVSTRQRLSQHETQPACSGCHSLMDPIGFGFENYDAMGRYRTTDGNQPVDATGSITVTDVDGPFAGVAQLATMLSASAQVQQCVARQWFRFMMNRYEQAPDNCSMQSLFDAFQAAGTNLNALPQALVQSDAFIYRRPPSLSGADAGISDSSAEVSK